MSQGVDYAWSHPKASSIRARGYVLALRYLSTDASKNLTPAERDDLLSVGLDIVLVWETTAQRSKSGAAGGDSDGRAALAQARALGLPDAAALYFAVDYGAPAGDLSLIAQYGRAFAAAIAPHPCGVYGSFSVCDYMLRNGVAHYAWQTVAWSGGGHLASAHLYQRLGQVQIDGVSCDVNDVLQSDYGGWHSASTPPMPEPFVAYHSEADHVDIIEVAVPTDAGGRGWKQLVNVDPAKVVGVAPVGPDPSAHGLDGKEIGYPPMGTWGTAPYHGGGTVVTVIGGFPSGVARCHVSVAT